MRYALKNQFIPNERCSSSEGISSIVYSIFIEILSFFQHYKKRIYKACKDFRVYSHCQEYYLFQYDSNRRACHSYFHEDCMIVLGCSVDIDKDFTGITETLVLTPNRLDRLPLHLNRWEGSMSIAIQMNENELSTVAQVVTSIKRGNIRFTLYVVRKNTQDSGCNYVSRSKTVVHFNQCFVINELRNLAIETIRTTHFMVIDGDGILSST